MLADRLSPGHPGRTALSPLEVCVERDADRKRLTQSPGGGAYAVVPLRLQYANGGPGRASTNQPVFLDFSFSATYHTTFIFL